MHRDEDGESVAESGGAQRIWGEDGGSANDVGEVVNAEEDGVKGQGTADLPDVRRRGEMAEADGGYVEVCSVRAAKKPAVNHARIGRPPKDQFAIFKKFLEGIERGLTFEKSAKLAGSSHDAIKVWRERDPHLEKQLQALLDKMRDERIEKYLGFIRAGHFPSDAAILSGLSRQVMGQWAKNDPEIAEREQVALVYFKDVHLRAVQDADVAKNKGWVPHAWMLERRFPHEYGQHNTVTVDGNVAKEMEQELNAGRERARKSRVERTDEQAHQRGSQLLQ